MTIIDLESVRGLTEDEAQEHLKIHGYNELPPAYRRGLSWIFAGTLVCLLLVLFIPVLQDLFRFSAISAADLAACIVAGGASVFWFEGYKMLVREKEPIIHGKGERD